MITPIALAMFMQSAPNGLIGTLPDRSRTIQITSLPAQANPKPQPFPKSLSAKLGKGQGHHCEDGTKVTVYERSRGKVSVYENADSTIIRGKGGASFQVERLNGNDTVSVGSGEAVVSGMSGAVKLGSSSEATVTCTPDGSGIVVYQSGAPTYIVEPGHSAKFEDGKLVQPEEDVAQ